MALPQSLRQVTPLSFLHVRVVRATNLPNVDSGIMGDVSDPYVCLRVNDPDWARTETKWNNLNPFYDESFFFAVHSNDTLLFIRIYDANETRKDQRMGTCEVRFREISKNERTQMTLPVGS